MRFSIPVIPGFNDSEENIRNTAEFAVELKKLGANLEGVDLEPFHSYAEGKYDQLDRAYSFKGLPSLANEDIQGLRGIVESYHIETTFGRLVGLGEDVG